MSLNEVELLRKRAEDFLKAAEKLYLGRKYDLAAFCIEQYYQLLLKFKLLLRTGTYPRTRSIIGMLRLLSDITESAKALLEDSQNILYLTKIEDAYIGARYLPRSYEESEVMDMLRFAREVFGKVVGEI